MRSLAGFDLRVWFRRKIAGVYLDQLPKDHSHLTLPPFSEGYTWSHFPVLVPPEIRDYIVETMEKKYGYELGIIVDYSVADMQAYKALGHPSCPNAKSHSQSVLNLPLTFAERGRTCNDLNKKAQALASDFVDVLDDAVRNHNV